jgi:phospholipase C
MPNKPNFQMSRQTVTLDMIRTYNDNQPKKRKKNKPKTHQKRTKNEQKRAKTNENEQNSTPKTPCKSSCGFNWPRV